MSYNWENNTTDDKSEYKNIWISHIKQLESLGLPLMDNNIELYNELGLIKERLMNLVFIAAEEEFKV